MFTTLDIIPSCKYKSYMTELEYIQSELTRGLTVSQISTNLKRAPTYITSKYKDYIDYNKIFVPLYAPADATKQAKIKTKITNEGIELIKTLIISQTSTTEISKITGFCAPTITKYVRLLPELNGLYSTLRATNIKKQYTSSKGKTNGRWRKNAGKTYEEIYGKERAVEMRECRRTWLKQNNIRKYNTKVSKPQQMLYEIVKQAFPTAVLEYKVTYNQLDNKYIYLDIAIPDKMIDIEYDGMYWHTTNTAVIPDNSRDKRLVELGWQVIRFKYTNNPKREKLLEDFNNSDIMKHGKQ